LFQCYISFLNTFFNLYAENHVLAVINTCRLENVIGRPDVVANAVNESCLTTAAMVRVKTCRHDRSILHTPMITVLFGSPLHCQMSRSLLSAHLNAASLILVKSNQIKSNIFCSRRCKIAQYKEPIQSLEQGHKGL